MIGWILLLVVLGGVAYWLYARGPGIVIPIPVSVITMTKEHTGGGLLLVWRLLLLALIPTFIVLFLSMNPGAVAIGVVTALIAALFFNPIKRALADVWNFRFPTLEG